MQPSLRFQNMYATATIAVAALGIALLAAAAPPVPADSAGTSAYLQTLIRGV